jgi:protein O-mannosyl-transferase
MKNKNREVPKTINSKPPERLNVLYSPVFHILLIVITGFIIYSNTFHVPFQFDDLREILRNNIIRNLNNFINLSPYKTRHIAFLTFAVNYALHGTNVVGYHLVNLAVHIVNTLFVYWLVILSFKTPTLKESSLKDSSQIIALFSALLFACHPVQTEAVTYIVQRLASLATLFYLFSIICYSKARLELQEARPTGKRFLWYGVSLFSAVLAMKTKEISFTLPVMLALYEFLFFKTEMKKRILYLLFFLLTMLIIPLSLLSISKPLGDVIGDVSEIKMGHINFSRWDYLFTEFRVITTYIRLLFLPVNQNLIYDYPIFHSFFNTEVFLSFLLLLSIFILGIYLFYRYRRTSPHTTLISFGIFWFFITLSVESSIIPISDVIFEHRLYLPSIGFFISVVTFVIGVRTRLISVMPAAGKAIIPLLIVITVVLSGATLQRNAIWKDKLTLWSDVVKKSPNAPGPRNNLGIAYEQQGLPDKAIEQYQIVLARYPNNAEAHHNLGIAFAAKGWIEKAIEQYHAALRLRPNYYDTHFNLGVAFFSQGQIDKAIEQYQLALKSKPGFAEAYVNLGIAYGTKGSTDKAIQQFLTAVQLKPDLAEAHNNLGTAYEQSGSTDKAIEQFLTAVKLKPDYANAQYNLGKAYLTSGLIDKAVEHLQIAVRLQPDYANAQYNLGKAYLTSGSIDKAVEHLQIAARLQPDFADAHKYLGDALYSKGLIDIAIEQFQRAVDLKPGFSEAHKNLGDAFVKKGSLDQAIKQYQIASRLNPKLIDALYNLGVVFYNKGSADKAIEYFQRALKLRPDFAEAHNSLGTVYLKLGAIDKAADQFQTAVQLNPSNSLFLNNLNNVHNYKLKTKADTLKHDSNR